MIFIDIASFSLVPFLCSGWPDRTYNTIASACFLPKKETWILLSFLPCRNNEAKGILISLRLNRVRGRIRIEDDYNERLEYN